MSEVLAVTQDSFEEEVVKSDNPVLVDFWAVWCGPCKMLAPVVEELAKEYDGRAKFVSVNVDDERGVALKYNIHSIPTLIFFKGGSPAGQIVGVKPRSEIAAKLDELLSG